MTRSNYNIGNKYEEIGKEYLRSLGYKEDKSKDSPFDFPTKGCGFDFDIKTKQFICSRKYTFDFTERQLTFRKSKKKLKILIILLKGNNHEFRIVDMDDFQNVDRPSNYKVFNALRRIRLTLKKEKRAY